MSHFSPEMSLASGGMLSWSPAEWGIFIGIIATPLAALGAWLRISISGLIKDLAAFKQATNRQITDVKNTAIVAKDTAIIANTAAAVVSSRVDDNTRRSAAIRRDLSVTQLLVNPTANPLTVETLAKAMETASNANNAPIPPENNSTSEVVSPPKIS